MRFEWNEHGFSASMDNQPPTPPQTEMPTGIEVLRENRALTLGTVAFICALVNVLFGLFLNVSTEVVAYFAEQMAAHWMIVFLIFSIVLFSVSVVSGIFSIIFYTKSRKRTLDAIGLVLSIFAFVVGFSGLILNIVAIIVW